MSVAQDGPPETLPVDHADLLLQVHAALAAVSQERAILTLRAQELNGGMQLLDERSGELAELRSGIEERLEMIAAVEAKLSVAEVRLQQLTSGSAADQPEVHRAETGSQALPEQGRRSRLSRKPRRFGFGDRSGSRRRRPGRLSGVPQLRMSAIVVGMCSVVLVAVVLGAIVEGSTFVPPDAPIIERVTLDPAQPGIGEAVTIRWDVANADAIEIQPLVSNLDADLGAYTFTSGFDRDTTLTIRASNNEGRTEQSVTVAVRERADAPTSTQTLEADVASQASTATASEVPRPSATTTPLSEPQVVPNTPTATSPPVATPYVTPTQLPATPDQLATSTAQATPSAEAHPSPTPTDAPFDAGVSPTPVAAVPTSVSACSPAGTLPAGSYCDESGVFTVWVFACEAPQMSVDWGDGVIERYEGLVSGESASHQYTLPGTYDVLVISICPQSEMSVRYVFQFPD